MKLARARPEFDLQCHVVRILRAYARPSVCWWVNMNGMRLSPKTAADFKAMGVFAGPPDLNFLVDGAYHGLELKVEGGRQSEAQSEFQMWVQRAGGHYHLAVGIDQAIGVLSAINVFEPSAAFDGLGRVRRGSAPAVRSPNYSGSSSEAGASGVRTA